MRERKDLSPAQAKRQAQRKAYYQAHRDEIRQQQREYRARHKERFTEYDRRARQKRKAQRAENRQKPQIAAMGQKDLRTYYERNRYELCKRRIGKECFRAIEKVRSLCPERVNRYLEQWPFEAYADKRIKSQLWWWRIYPQHHLYSDCYDAGMLAYLYSIHRCAMMEYQHVNQYIAKMVRIFVICALNAGRETENLCRENDLRLCHMDHDVFDA